MMVIITGENRVEICVPNKRQEGLHFFKTRNQLYRIYPNALSRVRIFDYDGLEVGSEEGIIYRENDIVPYDTMDLDYSMDRLLADVDRHKIMREGGWKKAPKKVWFSSKNMSGIGSFLLNKVGITWLIVGGVVAYAFLAPMLGL